MISKKRFLHCLTWKKNEKLNQYKPRDSEPIGKIKIKVGIINSNIIWYQ